MLLSVAVVTMALPFIVASVLAGPGSGILISATAEIGDTLAPWVAVFTSLVLGYALWLTICAKIKR